MKFLASAWSGLALLCAAFAVPAYAAGGLAVVALAADVQAVVLRDAEGHLSRYRAGQVLPGGTWKVLAVHDADVELQALSAIDGHAVSTRLRSGDSLDSGAIERLRAAQEHATPRAAAPTHP
jgi:hypothetical protein